MRKPYIAGNWKMFGDRKSAAEYIDGFSVPEENTKDREIVICPPFTLLQYWSENAPAKKPYLQWGAQDVHWEKNGAFTGNVSVPMLLDMGCKNCIVGHSERRAYHAETDGQINKKMIALLDAGIVPIVCVGETLKQREAGDKEKVVGGQTDGSVLASAGRPDFSKIVIAYEPVWAIGTGVTATSEQAQEMCKFIRDRLRAKVGAVAEEIRILYGGSVKPGNIDELMSQADIDGVLVGGASLKASDFSAIANFKK
jgi:triosephosphate isomerase